LRLQSSLLPALNRQQRPSQTTHASGGSLDQPPDLAMSRVFTLGEMLRIFLSALAGFAQQPEW